MKQSIFLLLLGASTLWSTLYIASVIGPKTWRNYAPLVLHLAMIVTLFWGKV